jgi:hypothetical protein
MSNPSRTLSSRPRAEHSGSMDDVPPAYVPAVTPPTPVAEDGPSTSTGRERERMSPHTSPTVPIRTHQPERLDPMHPPLSLHPSLSRNNSHRSSNAAPTSAASSTEVPRGRAKDARLVTQPEAVVPMIENEAPKQNVINIFCCCSSRGALPSHFSMISLPTYFFKPNNGLPVERTNKLSRPGFAITVGKTLRYQAITKAQSQLYLYHDESRLVRCVKPPLEHASPFQVISISARDGLRVSMTT